MLFRENWLRGQKVFARDRARVRAHVTKRPMTAHSRLGSVATVATVCLCVFVRRSMRANHPRTIVMKIMFVHHVLHRVRTLPEGMVAR